MFYNAALKRTTLQPYDIALLWVTVAIVLIGLVMVYSASISIAEQRSASHSGQYYLWRQLAYLMIAVVVAVATFRVPSNQLQGLSAGIFVMAALLLILVLIPGIGRSVNGSLRWISLGPLGAFQPSELMKLATVLYAADYTARKAAMMGSIKKGFLPLFLAMLGIAVLLQMEPDLGATMVIVAIAMGILFLGGLNLRLFMLLLVLLLIGVVFLIWLEPFRLDRLRTYTDPWADPYNRGYQVTHALMAFGRGGWLGVGLGESVEKLSYLPEAHTDFLLAILAEELGAIAILVVLGLFAWLIWRAFSIGWQASLMGRNFQALAAQGVGVWMGAQAFINAGVNLGMLPAKGLTLPLMSYGGTGLLVNCLAITLLLRIDFENRLMMRGGRP